MAIQNLDIKKKEEEEKQKQRKKIFKLYLFPLFTIAVFVTIIVAVIIPKVNKIFAKVDAIAVDNEESANLIQKINDLTNLNTASLILQDQLSIVNSIASAQSSEVIKFRDKIANLAVASNLEVLSQKLSETAVDTGSDTQAVSGNINLIEVPLTFEIAGNFSDINNFIKELDTIDDFTIVKEMELSANIQESDSDSWTLKINLVKYQFIESDKLTKIYSEVSPLSRISEKMKAYLELRR